MSQHVYDVIVIGAVPPGELLAGRDAGRGQEVAIDASDLVGGECSVTPERRQRRCRVRAGRSPDQPRPGRGRSG